MYLYTQMCVLMTLFDKYCLISAMTTDGLIDYQTSHAIDSHDLIYAQNV